MTILIKTALGGLVAAALCGPAAAQTSLFGQPLAPAPATEPAPAEAAPRVRPKPKPRGPVPARSLTISNASSNTLTSLEITGEGKTARLAKPLAPQARATLKLPALKRCVVTVAAAFENAGEAEASDYDVCREKSIRFTD